METTSVLTPPETGPELQRLREDAGLLAADLAVEMGIRLDTMSRLERGRQPLPAGFAVRYRETVRRLYTARHEKVAPQLAARQPEPVA